MTRKPRNILLGVLLFIALSAVSVRIMQADAAQRRQQALNNALLNAIPDHHLADVRDLLRRGADPNCQQQPASLSDRLYSASPAVWHHFYLDTRPLFMTPLTLAVLNSQQDTIQVLLDAGANVKQKDSYGEIALDVDANGEDSIYKMLKNAAAKQKNHAVNGTAIERGR